MAISLLSRAVLGALIALLCVVVPAGAHAAHPATNDRLPENDLFRAEARVLGPEHAREHAALRRLERLGVETERPSRPPLASSGTVFSSSIAAERSLGDTGGPSAAAFPEDTLGRWQPPFTIPVMAINAALLPTGKVLWYSYPANPNPIVGGGPDEPNTAQAWLWDPASGRTKRVDPPLWLDPKDNTMKPANIWCSGTSFLADGRVVVAGGNLDYRRPGQEFKGLNTVFTFDPFSETWTRQPDMEHGRWYPTQARLPDGRTVILSGLDESGNADPSQYPVNKQVEVFTPSPESNLRGVGTLELMIGEINSSGAPGVGGLYPHAFWMPSGRLLIAGPDENDSWFLNGVDTSQPLANQDTQVFPQQDRQRLFGSAVLLPDAPDSPSTKVMQIGGWSDLAAEAPPRTASTETVDETTLPGTTWVTDAEQLNVERAHQNTVLLPDGSMVTVGGGIGKDEDGIAPDLQQWGAEPDQKQVELWDPTTGAWSYGAAQAEYRTYHSTAILLPDGRVVSAGDDYNGGFDQDTAEIYEPPYLFKGPRPVISSAPQVGVLNQSLDVATPDPATVNRAALVAPGATTHANDMNQRYYALTTMPGAGKVSMDLPDEDSVPPGWYMLFLLSDQGVPSIAHWIRIGDAGTPQPGQIVIEQDAEPVDANPFSFSGAPFTDFDLTAGGTHSATVLAGEYQVTQAVEPGYDLTSLSCDDGALTPSSTDTATRRATVRVSAGEVVRCTFTNIKRAQVTIEQRADPASGGSFSFDGSLGSFQLADGETTSFDLPPGDYSTVQAAKPGYELDSITCDDPVLSPSQGDVAAREATVKLSAGENVRCVFSNFKRGHVTIEQRVQPGGSDPFSFVGSLGNFGLPDGGTTSFDLPPGDYSVEQLAAAGYDLTSVSCDDGGLSPSVGDVGGRKALVKLSGDETVRCTFTNVKRAGLTVQQHVQPSSTSPFSFGGSLGDFELADTQTRSFDLSPGEYSLTQAARSGYALSAASCDDSDSSASVVSRSVTARLSPGEHVTCSFSSRDAGAPSVRFSGLNRRKKTLTGNATDLAGVTKLSAALSQRAGRKCRWWSPRRRAFARRATACSKPAFIRASLRRTSTGRSWSVALRGLPRAGRYRVVASATDALGNTGRPSFILRVPRR